MSTSRDLVLQTLALDGPHRAPRDLWALPWSEMNHPDELAALRRDFPSDFVVAPLPLDAPLATTGDPHRIGTFVDEWGTTWENLQDGVIGEVKDPLVKDWERDAARVHIPRETLSARVAEIDAFCAEEQRFVLAPCVPRPFERLQFLRGTEDLMVDLIERPPGFPEFMAEMHAFHCEWMQLAARTRVDGLLFMDDWGAQHALLINPTLWRELFKPMYRDFAEIAHGADKKLFMHSDGHILAILPDLIEVGIDAINSQIFCMGTEALEPFAGKITFWGEVDRQRLLTFATREEVDAAVRDAHRRLWRNGGMIAQCEFTAGAKPANVRQVYETWASIMAP